jgi:hypothetical protein
MQSAVEATLSTHQNQSLFDSTDLERLMSIVARYQATHEDFMLVLAGTEMSHQLPMQLFSVTIQNSGIDVSDPGYLEILEKINKMRDQVVSQGTTPSKKTTSDTISVEDPKLMYFNQVLPHCSCLSPVVMECGSWSPSLSGKKQKWLMQAISSEFFQHWSPAK